MKTTDTACIVHAGLRCRMCAVVIAVGVALAAAPWSQALAQGSEPRLLMPPGAGSPSAGPDPSTPIVPPAPAATNPPAFQAGNPAAARLEIRMTQLEQDLRAVTGRLEEVSYQLRKLDERLSKVTSDMEYRFSQIKTGAATEPSKESLPGGASSGNLAGSGGAPPASPALPVSHRPPMRLRHAEPPLRRPVRRHLRPPACRQKRPANSMRALFRCWRNATTRKRAPSSATF